EADYLQNCASPGATHLRFWLGELRTPELLVDLAAQHPDLCRELIPERLLLALALRGDTDALGHALGEEERQGGERDRAYWRALKRELEKLRHEQLGQE